MILKRIATALAPSNLFVEYGSQHLYVHAGPP